MDGVLVSAGRETWHAVMMSVDFFRSFLCPCVHHAQGIHFVAVSLPKSERKTEQEQWKK